MPAKNGPLLCLRDSIAQEITRNYPERESRYRVFANPTLRGNYEPWPKKKYVEDILGSFHFGMGISTGQQTHQGINGNC
ncbi:hypothetical protein CCP3SC1_50004 [Gammaproteobacteria bacterium]